LRRVRVCIGRARCPLWPEGKVNFTILPCYKVTEGSRSMALPFL
jgi:hypothetical protein